MTGNKSLYRNIIKVCTETFCICFSLTVREVRRENDISKRCMYRKKTGVLVFKQGYKV